MSTSVGFWIVSATPSRAASAWTNVVFPAPKSPRSATTIAQSFLSAIQITESTFPANSGRSLSSTFGITGYNIAYMVVFADEEQQKRLDFLRKREEEELAQVLSGKYGVQYVDLSLVAVNVDALRVL